MHVNDEIETLIKQRKDCTRSRYVQLTKCVLTIISDKRKYEFKNYLKCAQDAENTSIDEIMLSLIRTVIDGSRKVIGIVSHSSIWSQLGYDFPDLLDRSGYQCIVLSDKEHLDVNKLSMPITREMLCRMTFLDICIGFELPQCMASSGVKRVEIERTARHVYSGNRTQLHRLLKLGSYFVWPVVGDVKKHEEFPEGIKIPAEIVGSNKTSYILPMVPAKYERIREIREGLDRAAIDRILICPTAADLPEYFVNEYGQRIVAELLRRFPDYKIVFRPRPENRKRQEVRDLVARFSDDPRFIYDDRDDYAEQYAHGALLITDRSSTGQTFTLATKCPSLYFPRAPGWVAVPEKDLIDVGCIRVSSFEQLFDQVEETIKNPTRCREPVERVLQKYECNNGSFRGTFLKYLVDIADGRVNEDWYTITINEENVVGSDAEGYETSLLSILDQNWGERATFHIIDRLGLINKYLEYKAASQTEVPGSMLKRIAEVCVGKYRVSHENYDHILRGVVDAALHNLRLRLSDDDAVTVLISTGNAVAERASHPAAERYWRQVEEGLSMWPTDQWPQELAEYKAGRRFPVG